MRSIIAFNIIILMTVLLAGCGRQKAADNMEFAEKTSAKAETLFKKGRPDEAINIMESALKSASVSREEKAYLAPRFINLLIDANMQEKAVASFTASTHLVDDINLNILFERLQESIRTSGRTDISDQLCSFVLTDLRNVPGTKNSAAERWLMNVNGNHAETIRRMEKLFVMDINPSLLLNLYRSSFYRIMESRNKELMSRMSSLGPLLENKLLGRPEADDLIYLSLDAAFILEDYKQALKILEKGVPGKDRSWHVFAMTKIKAHLCLEEGNPIEAIQYFREFMKNIEKEDQPETDPSTDITHTKDMILGRNAKRIGDIYASTGDKTNAYKAYEEAMAYYNKALENTVKNERSHELTVKEAEELKNIMAGYSFTEKTAEP